MDSDSIEEQLATRDRFRRAQILRQTPEERLNAFWALQESSLAILQKNPEAYERYLRANFRKRAIPRPPDTT
jgi:hypothetical protein